MTNAIITETVKYDAGLIQIEGNCFLFNKFQQRKEDYKEYKNDDDSLVVSINYICDAFIERPEKGEDPDYWEWRNQFYGREKNNDR